MNNQFSGLILLLGTERSGTNLLQKMFGANGNVHAPSISHIFRVANILDSKPLTETEKVNYLLESFSLKIGNWIIDDKAILNSLKKKHLSLGEFVIGMLEEELSKAGKKQIFIKENHVFESFKFIEKISISTKAVQLVRDPRDVAVSWKRATSLRGGVIKSTNRWIGDYKNHQRLSGILQDNTVMRYEDLIENPEFELMRSCREIDLDYSPEMLNYFSSDQVVADAETNPDWKNIKNPIMRDNQRKFEKSLSELEIRYIESVCKEPMIEHGYDVQDGDELSAKEFKELKKLEDSLQEKPEFQELPEEARARFTKWSNLITNLSEL